MQMTVEEIIRSYTQAKDKSKQIGILADPNGCDKGKIRSILRTRGVELPTKGRPKKEREIIKTDFDYNKANKTVTIKNLSTGETITKPLEELVIKKDNKLTETKPHGEQPIEAKLFIPEVVKGLVIERISQIEFEITKLKLDKEELEDFLEQFADDV